MLRARLIGPRTFDIEEVATPEPGAGEVRLRTDYVALCGSEFPAYLGIATAFPLYERRLEYPRYLGHEASSVVDALGA